MCREPITAVGGSGPSYTLTLGSPWATGGSSCPSSGAYTIYWPNVNAVWLDSFLGQSVDQNSFGHRYTGIDLDLEGLPMAAAYYCQNCEENTDISGLTVNWSENVFGTGNLPVAACYMFDSSLGPGIGNGNFFADKIGNCSQGSGVALGGLSSGPGNAVDDMQGPYGLMLECWSSLSSKSLGGPQGWVTTGSITASGTNGQMEAGNFIDGCVGTYVAKDHLERAVRAGTWVGAVNPTKGVFVAGPSTSSFTKDSALALFDTHTTDSVVGPGGSADVANVYLWNDLANSLNSGLTASGGGVMGSGTGLGALDQYCQDGIGAHGSLMASSLMDTTGTSVATLAPNALQLLGTPTAPTPATSDNSTKIATTAYVQVQGYAVLPVSPGAALTPGTNGQAVITSGGAAVWGTVGCAQVTNCPQLSSSRVMTQMNNCSSASPCAVAQFSLAASTSYSFTCHGYWNGDTAGAYKFVVGVASGFSVLGGGIRMYTDNAGTSADNYTVGSDLIQSATLSSTGNQYEFDVFGSVTTNANAQLWQLTFQKVTTGGNGRIFVGTQCELYN